VKLRVRKKMYAGLIKGESEENWGGKREECPEVSS